MLGQILSIAFYVLYPLYYDFGLENVLLSPAICSGHYFVSGFDTHKKIWDQQYLLSTQQDIIGKCKVKEAPQYLVGLLLVYWQNPNYWQISDHPFAINFCSFILATPLLGYINFSCSCNRGLIYLTTTVPNSWQSHQSSFSSSFCCSPSVPVANALWSQVNISDYSAWIQ